MMLVLLNDADDSHTLLLFIAHVHAITNRVVMIFKNRQASFSDKISNQEECLSASVQKKKTKKDVQMLEHSSHNEGVAKLRHGYVSRGLKVIHLGLHHLTRLII